MLLHFLYALRAHKIQVGTQEWLDLMQALAKDLAHSSLTRFYYLARAVLVKAEHLYDAYDQAFLFCFSGCSEEIDFKKALSDWLDRFVDPGQRPPLPGDTAALDLETLRQRFLERLRQQQEAHHGGNYWIGTGGTSPFGHSGAHPSGIRLGGPGGGRSAVKIAEARSFANYRHDRILDTRQFKVALKRLRRLDRTGSAQELLLDESIDQTCKNAGEIELVFAPLKKNQAELLLLMDVGGSMDSYAAWVEALFSAAHASKHFKAFEHFYFHNCIYSKLYSDMGCLKTFPTEELFKKFRPSFHVMIVGDACMHPYELFAADGSIDYWERHREPGIEWLKKIKRHFTSLVWLNPEKQSYWPFHPTIQAIAQQIPMYPLSVEGLTEAVDRLRRGARLTV